MCFVEHPELVPHLDVLRYVEPAQGHRVNAGHEGGHLAVHHHFQRIPPQILGQAAQVGTPIERVRDAEARQRARILAVARGPLQPVPGAAVVSSDQHVGGVRRQHRSRRRLEEAVARRELAGADEVEQLFARLPAHIGVHGHRHGRRTVGDLRDGIGVVRAFNVDADALQPVPEPGRDRS